jgi:hypothetical protein
MELPKEKGMTTVFEKEHRGRCSFKGEGIVTPCFPQFVINHKIGISMIMREDNVNVLLFELSITDYGGEALKVLAMISLEERNKLMRKGLVVEKSTTPMNGNMGCQPEVPQGPTYLSFLLTQGT